MSYRMQTCAIILDKLAWIYHQTCSGGATEVGVRMSTGSYFTWGISALYIYCFGPFPLANQISRKALGHGGKFNQE